MTLLQFLGNNKDKSYTIKELRANKIDILRRTLRQLERAGFIKKEVSYENNHKVDIKGRSITLPGTMMYKYSLV